MPYKIGDSARVKKGIRCPDNDSLCMAGWQGRIFEIEEVIGIRWDSITLKQLPLDYIKQSEEEGLDWSEIYLSADEIEPASPRDSEETADDVREEMESSSIWLSEWEEGNSILKVIADAEDKIEAWHNHLTKVLQFPFDAEVSEAQDEGPLEDGDQVQFQEKLKLTC